jgi:hypothetical protein
MALIQGFLVQGAQMALVLALAPLLTGFVRKIKARLLRRQGPSVVQPYRDLLRLLRKEVILSDGASWLFRAAPYMIFAATWVAAALVPTFAAGLLFSWSADLIAIIALLGSARFFLALAGLDVGTSFGGIGSSREVMIASASNRDAGTRIPPTKNVSSCATECRVPCRHRPRSSLRTPFSPGPRSWHCSRNRSSSGRRPTSRRVSPSL